MLLPTRPVDPHTPPEYVKPFAALMNAAVPPLVWVPLTTQGGGSAVAPEPQNGGDADDQEPRKGAMPLMMSPKQGQCPQVGSLGLGAM